MLRRLSAFGIIECLVLVAFVASEAIMAVEPLRVRGDQSSMATQQVELFAAMEAKMVDALFIPADSSRAKITIRNLTDQPLAIILPRTFAGVPVLGQFGNGGGQGFGLQGGGNGGFGLGGGGQFGGGIGGGIGGGGGGQAIGGGFGQGQQGGGFGLGNGLGGNGGGLGLNGGGGGFFRIEPDKVRKIDVSTVCLEHGKLDPNARMKYRIVPLQDWTTDLRIEALCLQLAAGSVSQKVAQAAAWNIANGLSWEALAAKDRKISAYTGREKYFSSAELKSAIKLTAYCGEFLRDVSSHSSSEWDRLVDPTINLLISR